MKNETLDQIMMCILDKDQLSYKTGAGLPGVSVVVKVTTTGVITDMDGKYILVKVPENATLQFSFVGMKAQEIEVGNKTNINVTLIEDAIGIEEVVAVGYGTQKRRDVIGSVSTIKSRESYLYQVPLFGGCTSRTVKYF